MAREHIRPLHFAESLSDLHRKTRAGMLNVEDTSARLILDFAATISRAQALTHLSEGDEELTYFFLHQFLEYVSEAKKKEDYTRFFSLYKHLLASETNSIQELDKLRSSLLMRYSPQTPECSRSPSPSPLSPRKKVDDELLPRFVGNFRDLECGSSSVRKKEKQVVEVCNLKIRKLPLNFSQLLGPSFSSSFTSSSSSSKPELLQESVPSSLSAKITVLDIDPQPGNASWESSQFCDDLKRKTFGVNGCGGGGELSFIISFQAECLDEGRKVLGMSIRVDGSFVERLFADCELEQSLEMRLTMRIVGKRDDLLLRDANMKVFRSGNTAWFGIYVGLIALDEWIHYDAQPQPRVKVILQLQLMKSVQSTEEKHKRWTSESAFPSNATSKTSCD
ncbi:unnamed protein product [Orchesella dallaii]|uniref:USP8 dimerisation domain-containing protein n=1 Tax=Orchesella dallaii TaxID=48710 RepID=A0ABP1QMR2_9HEXA